MELDLKNSLCAKQWEHVGIKQRHGINVPLFSLHSRTSGGIGTFTNLLPLIDWCASIGFNVIQLLPLNDSGLDASPYNALSAFALNPIHIDLNALPFLDSFPHLCEELKALTEVLAAEHKRIDYPHVRSTKDRFLRRYYAAVKERLVTSDDYAAFVAAMPWLQSYALFKTIKAQQGQQNWQYWPEHLRTPTPENLSKLYEEHAEEIEWHCTLQYLCDMQLRSVKEKGTEKGVLIMGDIPILISPDSADVWLQPYLFDLKNSAGAPPDMYSIDGQNWGFPLYNWEEIGKHCFRWWRDRLQTASRYYQLFRIDHIVGFFRIWAIPLGASAKEGRFIPEDPNTWIEHGKTILSKLIVASDMLPIGEDLGTIPPESRICMRELGICGTKVMRWERDWNGDRHFVAIEEYPPMSLTTVSTHDSETLPLWWRDNPIEAQEYAASQGWTYNPTLTHDQQQALLWASHHTSSLFHINLLQEYLALIPGLTWPQLEDERINIPGTISPNNWAYQFRPSVEEIVSNKELADLMRALIQDRIP